MGTTQPGPAAAVPRLALTAAVLFSSVMALITIVLKIRERRTIGEALPAAAVAFAATMGLCLSSLSAVRLIWGPRRWGRRGTTLWRSQACASS